MMLLKCCTQYVSKFGKLSSGHRTGKGQFSYQSQRKAMLKHVQTIIQLHSFHMLKTSLVAQTVKRLSTMRETWVRALHWEDPLVEGMAMHSSILAWRIHGQRGLVGTWTENFQMFKLDLEKAEEPEIKLPTSIGSSKKQQSSRKTSTSVLLTMPKPLTVWITTNCGKFWKRWEY